MDFNQFFDAPLLNSQAQSPEQGQFEAKVQLDAPSSFDEHEQFDILGPFDVQGQLGAQDQSHENSPSFVQGQFDAQDQLAKQCQSRELGQTRKQVYFDDQGQFNEPQSPWFQSPLQAQSNDQPRSFAQPQSQVAYFPPTFEHPRPPPSTFTFTNYDFLSANDPIVRNNLNSAGVPVVSAILSPFYTVNQANTEGTLFGRSLAYLITDTVRFLNSYLPIIGITEPDDFETEDDLCAGIEMVIDTADGLKQDEVWVKLGWTDAVYGAFWAGIRGGYEDRKSRRA